MTDQRGQGRGSAGGEDPPPESLLPYEHWMEESLKGVVREALRHVVREGLPGDHHFYISFRTDAAGVQVPKRLLAQYPHEITVVVQHQYADLSVEEDRFSIKLWFSGIPTPLSVPFSALTGFADPHVRFGLRFTPPEPVTFEDQEAEPEPPPEAKPEPAPPTGPAPVVSLDAFRKRNT